MDHFCAQSFSLQNVKVLIVDEADKLLTEESMQAQVISVMKYVLDLSVLPAINLTISS